MTRIPREKRYNARGERLCTDCRRYLHVENFGPHKGMRDGLHPNCRGCERTRRQASVIRRVLAGDPALDARHLARLDRKRQGNAAAQRDRRDFALSLIALLQGKGFTLTDISRLAGVGTHTIYRIINDDIGRFLHHGTVDRLGRLVQATTDLPPAKRRGQGGNRPHPALDLVRARLARMDYLAELEAA